MSDEELDDPIERLDSLPLYNTNLSLMKIATKLNEVIKSTNKHHGKPPKYLDLELMSNNKTNSFESDWIRWVFNPAISVPRPSALFLALFTSDPGETGSTAGEPSGNGYARVSVPFTDPTVGSVSNSIDLAFGPSSASWGLITHVGVCKGSVRGVADLVYYGPLVTSVNVNAANLSPRFVNGTLTISEKNLFAGLAGSILGVATTTGDGTISGSSPSSFPNLSFTPPTGINADGTGTVMTTTFPVITGTSYAVSNDSQLATAIAAATWGDEIVLQAGAIFSDFVWPLKAGWSSGKWILMRSSRLGEISTDPYLLKQAFVDAKMATINSTNVNVPSVRFERAAVGLWLAGVRLINTSSVNYEDAIINFYPDPNLYGGNSLNGDTNNHVHHCVVDRIYIPEKLSGCRRGLGFNGKFLAALNFKIEGINDAANNDSQAIAGWIGPGPFKIINGHVEASAECILFGGAGPDINSEFPADGEIRNVLMYRRSSWESLIPTRNFKNLFEIKDGKRFLLQGCVFLNNWFDSQQNAIIQQSHNEGPAGHAPFNFSQDVHYRYCKFFNVSTIFNITDVGSGPPFPADNGSQRVEVSYCAQMDPMRLEASRISFFECANNLRSMDGINVHHNLTQGPGYYLFFTDTVFGHIKTNFKFNDNINAAVISGAAVTGNNGPVNTVALDDFCGSGNWQFRNNIVVNGLLSLGGGALLGAPHNNKDLASVNDIGLIGGGNYRLAPSSPYIGTGTGGSNPGPDWDILDTLTGWYQGEPA